MVQKLEAIKGGGGSIRVGTKGTVSSLMTRELESSEADLQRSVSCRQKPRTVPVYVACGAATPGRPHPRKLLDETSSSGSSNNINRSSPVAARKAKSFTRNTHHIPMLGSDNIALDRTPSRQKSDKRGSNIVEIVDIKCGHQDRAWASPIASRLKKLGFSKLSESII